jgi:hemerythrin superfamily protein
MLCKLVNAYVALSNMRDARAKIADDIKSGRPDEDARLTIREIIEAQLVTEDDRYRQLQGIAMENKMERSALK